MPKSFSSHEREAIAVALLDWGRELFSQYGLQKTSIHDITKSVGIAQGTFYKFYSSKEELYFDLLEQEEAKIQERFLQFAVSPDKDAKAQLKDLLLQTIDTVESNPLLRQLYFGSGMEALLRKLPPERLQEHMSKDNDAIRTMISNWQAEGLLVDKPADVVAGAFRSLFLLTTHRAEIGEDVYRSVMELHVELLAEGLIRKKG